MALVIELLKDSPVSFGEQAPSPYSLVSEVRSFLSGKEQPTSIGDMVRSEIGSKAGGALAAAVGCIAGAVFFDTGAPIVGAVEGCSSGAEVGAAAYSVVKSMKEISDLPDETEVRMDALQNIYTTMQSMYDLSRPSVFASPTPMPGPTPSAGPIRDMSISPPLLLR